MVWSEIIRKNALDAIYDGHSIDISICNSSMPVVIQGDKFISSAINDVVPVDRQYAASRTKLMPNEYSKTVYVEHVDGSRITTSRIIPTIEDVKVYAEKSVKVFFSDGSFEQATISGGDTFNLENGISICLTKKMLSGIAGEKNGSSVYNKLIDYAVKVERKNREAERKAAEEKAIHDRKIKKAIEKKKKRREKREQRERAEYISALAEAIKLANEK